MNKIKYIKLEDVNRDRQPYLDKNGRPFYRVSMKVEGNDNYLSGFAYSTDPIMNWKVGQEVDIEITNKQYNGKTYYNFRPTRQAGATSVLPRIINLEDRVQKLELELSKLTAKEQTFDDMDTPF